MATAMHRLDIFVDICRLCSGKQRGNINIFGNGDTNKTLKNNIKNKIQIDVTLDDPLPKTVCQKCCERLDNFVKFQDGCHKTQDKLMNDYLAIVEMSTADEDDEFQSHIASDEILNSLVEDNADLDELSTKIEIYADGTKEMSSTGTIGSIVQPRSDIVTLSLSEVYNDSSELADHNGEQVIVINSGIASDAQQLSPKSLSMSTGIPTYVIIKNEDGPITLVPISNTLHTSYSNNPANKVPIPRLTKENMCDPSVYTIPSEEDTEAVEPEPRSIQKRPKQKKGPTKKTIRVPTSKRVRKLVQKVSNTEYRCMMCGMSFPQNYRCEYHVRGHTGEMPFDCTVCGKSFVAMHMLKKHRQSHETGVRHLCNTCGRGFRSASNLHCHEKTHDTDTPAPFSCSICGKSFYFAASYAGHAETHLTHRDHACDRCPKNYKTRRHLAEHVARVHDGVTRHSCATCGKRFYRHTTYRQHLRLHTAERPYTCDVCGRCFNERTNLARHKQIHDKKKLLNTTYLEVEIETVIEPKELGNTAK